MAKQQGEAVISTAIPNQRQKKRSFKGINTLVLGSVIPVTLIIIWEILSRLGVFPAYQFPAPSTVW